MITALDIATNTGVAILYPNSEIVSFTITGDPIYQLSIIQQHVSQQSIVLVEDLIHFRFPTAVKKLANLHGFIVNSLLESGNEVYLTKPLNVRACLGIKAVKNAKKELFLALKNKVSKTVYKFTDNNSDAVAMLLAYKAIPLDSDFSITISKPFIQKSDYVSAKPIKFEKV